MIFGDLEGLKLPDIYLTGEENHHPLPPKNLIQETCPHWGSNLGPPHDRRACYRVLKTIQGLLKSSQYVLKNL